MAGSLDFVLGLEVEKFLHNAGLGEKGIIALVKASEFARSAFEGLHKVLERVGEGVWAQIERGAGLEQMSKRTGESVATLYQLQKAFGASGGSAEAVEPMLLRMQKALGGVNELGERTESVFGQMGLSMAGLRAGGSGQAMLAILERLGGMGQNAGMKGAGGIFGREGAAQAMALTRNMKEFREAFEAGARRGKDYERVAAAFEKIELAVRSIKDKLAPIYLAIAEGIAPALQSVLSFIKGIDLQPIADRIRAAFSKAGDIVAFVVENLSKGGEALGLALMAGLEKAEFYAAKFATTLGVAVAQALTMAIPAGFQAGLNLLAQFWNSLKTLISEGKRAGYQWAIDEQRQIRDANPKAWTPKQQRKLESFQKGEAAWRKSADDLAAAMDTATNKMMVDLTKGIASSLRKGLKAGSAAWSGFGEAPISEAEKQLKELMAGFHLALGSGDAKKEQEKKEVPALKVHQAVSSAWEKFGFVLNGGLNADYSRQTAENTRRAALFLERIATSGALGAAMNHIPL